MRRRPRRYVDPYEPSGIQFSGALVQLLEMGFGPDDSRAALAATANDIDAAAVRCRPIAPLEQRLCCPPRLRVCFQLSLRRLRRPAVDRLRVLLCDAGVAAAARLREPGRLGVAVGIEPAAEPTVRARARGADRRRPHGRRGELAPASLRLRQRILRRMGDLFRCRAQQTALQLEEEDAVVIVDDDEEEEP